MARFKRISQTPAEILLGLLYQDSPSLFVGDTEAVVTAVLLN
jgi:hypothetical protein